MESLQESGPGEKVRLKRLQKQNFIKGDTIKEPNDQFGRSMSVIEQLERIYRLKKRFLFHHLFVFRDLSKIIGACLGRAVSASVIE